MRRRRHVPSQESAFPDNVKLKTTSWIYRDNSPAVEEPPSTTDTIDSTNTPSSPAHDFSIGEGADIEIYSTPSYIDKDEDTRQLLNYSTDISIDPSEAVASLRRATQAGTSILQNDGIHKYGEVNRIKKQPIENDQNHQKEQKENKPIHEQSSQITGEEDSSSRQLPDSSGVTEAEVTRPQHNELTHTEIDFVSFTRRSKEDLLNRLQQTLRKGSLVLINLSRRGLGRDDAVLIKRAMTVCPQLSSLKLSYNNLGDSGAATISSGFVMEGGGHHSSISILDLGFNDVGESGCSELALHAIAGNPTLRTLYLSGNNIGEQGCLSLAGAILHGSGLACLHLAENEIGTVGVKALSRAVTETEARRVAQLRLAVSKGCTIEAIDANSIATMQELHLGGTSMKSEGFYSISNMILTNLSLRVLSLSANGINDQDINLFSQSISQEKAIPLEVLNLSFNEITCLGVECLMNAIWGSKTMRVLRLDNNRVRDRGAQLVAVVLSSIDLEVIDLASNHVTTVGIKAIMKSLSENSSVTSLNLSGIPLDPNASKAVCYALAYNTSLRSLYIDNCSTIHSAQRHIAAGVVSNQNASLRRMTGFHLGPIVVTLGLPKVLESWSNSQVLKFVALMWKRWRENRGDKHSAKISGDYASNKSLSSDAQTTKTVAKSTPADPKTVVMAAKNYLTQFSTSGGEVAPRSEPFDRELEDTSPLVPPNATLIERTLSGTLRAPVESSLNGIKTPGKTEQLPQVDETESSSVNLENNSSILEGAASPESPLPNSLHDKHARWLRIHFRSLCEITQLPFDGDEFRQLYNYYNSTVRVPSEDTENNDDDSLPLSSSDNECSVHSTLSSEIILKKPSRKILRHRSCESSFEKSTGNHAGRIGLEGGPISSSSGGKRRSWHLLESTDDDDQSQRSFDSLYIERKPKRAKNASKPRIAYYSRIREKLDDLTSKVSNEKEALALLRRLKFVENTLFEGKDAYELNANLINHSHESVTHGDVESILTVFLSYKP